uniref:Cysteine proteinases superfamily protein n=1 Tax=Zea mays TaxID=4577 RepID=A0A804M5Y7_MAIZE
MNQEAKDSRPSRSPSEPNLFLQWGSRKRLRCVKTRDDGSPSPSPSEGLRRAIPRATRPLLGADIAAFRRPSTFNRSRKSDSLVNEYRHSMALSLEKDKYYTTRGSPFDGNGFDFGSIAEEKGTTALPRFFVALSNKEKEEDFMAMKGCKLPQRPKKRPKLMQKCLLVMLTPLIQSVSFHFHCYDHAHPFDPAFCFISGRTIDGEPRSLVIRFVA